MKDSKVITTIDNADKLAQPYRNHQAISNYALDESVVIILNYYYLCKGEPNEQ